jgi:hypothetical protein
MTASALALLTLLGTTAREPWYENAFFGLHYDFHAGENDTELGRETTHEHIRAMLDKVKPDFVQYDCKGHAGWSSYPTKVGSPSPGIVNDGLRVWRDVTREMGIPLSIHFSGVFDMLAIQRHPEWARIDAEGNPHANYTDPLSGYRRDLMIPQLVEVITEYDLDGVWVDGENWASLPSWSDACIAEFTRRTGITEIPRKADDPHWHEWLAFQRDLFVEHVREYADALHAAKPGFAVCSNWMYSVRQPDPVDAPVDHLSGDFDPSFGGERASAEARFFSARNMPWNLMAWSFLRTADQNWTFKPAVHICQEVAISLAQGGAIFIYDQPQRSGRLNAWHQDILGEVADFCRVRKEYVFQTQTVPQVAVLHAQSHYYKYADPLFASFGTGNHAMEGALHALLENGYSVDLLNEEMLIERMGDYPLVVVPEQEDLPEALRAALSEHVRNGGHLLVSGHLAVTDFGDIAGCEPFDEPWYGGGYLPAGNGCAAFTGPVARTKVTEANELAPFLINQEPALNQAGFPAATLNRAGQGKVAMIHAGAFRAYYMGHYPLVRRFIGDVVDALEVPGLARMSGPPTVEMALRQKDGKTLVQLVNRGSANPLGHYRNMVEHVPDAGAFTVTVPMPARPKRCFTAPDPVGLDWTWANGTLTLRVGGLHIHNTVVVEME